MEEEAENEEAYKNPGQNLVTADGLESIGHRTRPLLCD
jgi:hypothetical protein